MKNSWKVWCAVVVCGCLPHLAMAASAQAQLQTFVDDVHAATGHFEQRILNADKSGATADAAAGGKRQSGVFAFQRPGKFRWDVRKPYQQLIVSDGDHVYQYDPDLDQVTERGANHAIGASPAAVLFGSGKLDEAFDVQARPSRDGLEWLRAVPKSPDAGFVHVDIGFSGGVPHRLELLDAFGQTSQIVLEDLKANPDLPADAFQFKVPDGVDLVKMD